MSYNYGGFDGGKPEKNPSAAVWLKYFDKDLYEAIDDQGILGLLRPRFGTTMTFLYPSEKSYRDKIVERLNGNDATLGVNMIQALVIRDYLNDPADWLEKKDNIPNAYGQKVELSSESSSKQVILANGAQLTLNKDFKSRDDNIAVWDYKGKAEMPLDGKPAQFVKRAPRSSGPKKRKSGGSGFPIVPHKGILARRLQDQAVCLLKDNITTFQEANPFTSACVSLLSYLRANSSNNLEKFNTMCEPNSVATFYAVVLPYTSKSILNEDVQSWLSDTRGICLDSNPNETWSNHVKELANLGHEMHEEALHNKSNMEGNLMKAEGENAYKKAFGEDWKLRLKGDELRFLINITMGNKNMTPVDFSQLFLDIEILYSPEPKGTETGSFFFVSSKADPVFLQTVSMFVSSRCFVSVPNPKPCVDKSEGFEQEVISFNDAFNSTKDIEPTSHLINDDDMYLSQKTSSPEADFVSGLKKALKGLPAEQRARLIESLQS